MSRVTPTVKSLATELFKKEQEIADLKENLSEKEDSIRSYAKTTLDLKRKLQESGKVFFYNRTG